MDIIQSLIDDCALEISDKLSSLAYYEQEYNRRLAKKRYLESMANPDDNEIQGCNYFISLYQSDVKSLQSDIERLKGWLDFLARVKGQNAGNL